MANWKSLLSEALLQNGETWDDVVSNTMSDREMEDYFDSWNGGDESCPFTIWTTDNVYFPLCPGCAGWIGSVSRTPNGKPTKHRG